MARRRKPRPERRFAVAVSRELAWDAKVAAMRDGRVERAQTFTDRRKAKARRACRGRTVR